MKTWIQSRRWDFTFPWFSFCAARFWNLLGVFLFTRFPPPIGAFDHFHFFLPRSTNQAQTLRMSQSHVFWKKLQKKRSRIRALGQGLGPLETLRHQRRDRCLQIGLWELLQEFHLGTPQHKRRGSTDDEVRCLCDRKSLILWRRNKPQKCRV